MVVGVAISGLGGRGVAVGGSDIWVVLFFSVVRGVSVEELAVTSENDWSPPSRNAREMTMIAIATAAMPATASQTPVFFLLDCEADGEWGEGGLLSDWESVLRPGGDSVPPPSPLNTED